MLFKHQVPSPRCQEVICIESVAAVQLNVCLCVFVSRRPEEEPMEEEEPL